MEKKLLNKLIKLISYALIICSYIAGHTYAGQLEVSPTKIFFKQDQKYYSIRIKNIAKENVFVQAELLKWEKQDNTKSKPTNSQYIYTPSKELILNPYIVEIKGESEQILRIGRRNIDKNIQEEQTYRLLISELPDQYNTTNGLKMLLRLSLPVFITPNETTEMDLTWNKKKYKDRVELSLYNPNNNHRMITKIELKDKLNKKLYDEQNAFIYLLPKQKYTWTINNSDIKSTGLNKIINNKDLVLAINTNSGAKDVSAVYADESTQESNSINLAKN